MEDPLILETFDVFDPVQTVPCSEVLNVRIEGQRVWVRFQVPGYREIEAANVEVVQAWGRTNEKLVE